MAVGAFDAVCVIAAVIAVTEMAGSAVRNQIILRMDAGISHIGTISKHTS